MTRCPWVRAPDASAPLHSGTRRLRCERCGRYDAEPLPPLAATNSASKAWRIGLPVGTRRSELPNAMWRGEYSSVAIILRNHGGGRACVGLRPKDLALIGLKPRGLPQVLCLSRAWPLARSNGVPAWYSDENEMLSCTPVCFWHVCHVCSLIIGMLVSLMAPFSALC